MSLKVCAPKPSMILKLLGMALLFMVYMIMCADSGLREIKSQKASCADAACSISLSSSGFMVCAKSGSFMAS